MISNEKMEKLWWQYKTEGERGDVHHITVIGLSEQPGDLPEEVVDPELPQTPGPVTSSVAALPATPEKV